MVPSWPAHPKNLTWGAVAGIAISPSGQIWTFNRGSVPVQVYSADGALVSSWGKGQFREPHQVRIDREGFVWLADSGQHVVKKFTPEGKILLTLGTPDEPGEDSTHLNRPTDVAVTPWRSDIRRGRYGNNRIVHFDDRGQFVRTWGSLDRARASSACLIRLPSILGAGFSWRIGITRACRSLINPAGSLTNGATCSSRGTSS